PVEAGEVAHVLAHRQVVVDARCLGEVADLPAQRRRAGRVASTVTRPDRITWVPTMARMRVVLPLPLGPISPVTTPAGMRALSPSRTRRRPRSTTRSATSMAVSMGSPIIQRSLNSTIGEIRDGPQPRPPRARPRRTREDATGPRPDPEGDRSPRDRTREDDPAAAAEQSGG